MFPEIQTNKRQMAMKWIKIVSNLKILVVADIELLKKIEQGWEDGNINHIYVFRMAAWLLPIFFIDLHNQLSSTHFFIRIKE